MTLSGDHHHYAHYERESGAGPRSTGSRRAAAARTRWGPPACSQIASCQRSKIRTVSARYSLGATSPTPARVRGDARRRRRQGGDAANAAWAVMIGGLYALIALAFADAVKDHAPDLTSGADGYSFFELLWDGGSTWSIVLVLAAPGRPHHVRRRQDRPAAEDPLPDPSTGSRTSCSGWPHR